MSLKFEVTKWNLELLPLFPSILYILFSKALQKIIVFCYLCNDNNRLWKIILIQINPYSISFNLHLPRKIISQLVDSTLQFCCLIDPILLFLIINGLLCKKKKKIWHMRIYTLAPLHISEFGSNNWSNPRKSK